MATLRPFLRFELLPVAPGCWSGDGARAQSLDGWNRHDQFANRADGALIDDLARDRIAYVPFFPLGGFTPPQSTALSDVAKGLGATPMQVALAWLLQRAPNILLIPGTASVGHLRENLAAAELKLPSEAVKALDQITSGVAAA